MKALLIALALAAAPVVHAQQFACQATYFTLDSQQQPVNPQPLEGVFAVDLQDSQILVTHNGRTVPYYRDGPVYVNGNNDYMSDVRGASNPRMMFIFSNFVTHEAMAFGQCEAVDK